MKKIRLIHLFLVSFTLFTCSSCERWYSQCATCSYESFGTKVDIGSYCGESLSDVQEEGYYAGGAYNQVTCVYED